MGSSGKAGPSRTWFILPTTGPDDLRCTATTPDGQGRLRRVTSGTSLSNGLGTFVAIASTPEGFPAGGT